uniref:Uncharacterized protein n=1 Tax=viral metagenome TaxID=1070528 RepID=A0A6C0I3V5_9ZZZZ
MSTEQDNITLTTAEEQPINGLFAPPSNEETNPTTEVKLTEIPVTNENMALNLMVSFLNVAQRRGAFSFDESAKIWECLQKFIKTPSAANTV